MLFSYQEKLTGHRVGVVFGSFAPLHQGHLDLIMRAKKENDAGCIVMVCGFTGDKGGDLMPLAKRYRYVREFFADDPLVAVYAINDTEIGADKYPNGWNKWMDAFYAIHDQAAAPNCKCRWYVGDPNYAEDLHKMFNEEAVLVNRLDKNPICATMIRNNPIKHWDKITFPFRRIFSTNILITGTASEGKSTLVNDLGKYFNAPHSYEWAREYMRESCVADWELDSADYLAFLEGQYNLNKKLINSPANHGIFFADTDALVTKMYARYYADDPSCALTSREYEKIAVVADELAAKSRWDKIYLLEPTSGFVDDHERFMKHADMSSRRTLYNHLCDFIKSSGDWDKVTVLNGGYWDNFQRIVTDVKAIIEHE